MAVFPDISPWPDETHTLTDGVVWQQTESGVDFGADPWGGRTKWNWSFSWKSLLPAEEQTLREFFAANRKGGFYLFHPSPRLVYSGLSVDELPNGSLDVFTLPGKSTSEVAVKVNGVEHADYAISAGAGTNGEDRVIFGSGLPIEGDGVTVDFTGRARYLARFNGPLIRIDSHPYPGLKVNLVEVWT